MFCNKCGKELPSEAQFCNFCGAPVTKVQPQPAPQQTYQPAPQPAPAPAAAKKQKKKKSNVIGIIISLVVALVVYFGVRFIAENFIFNKPSNNSSVNSSSSFISTETSSAVKEEPKESLTASCIYGGLYDEYDVFLYGPASLYLPDYELLPGENGEQDMLISSDGKYVVAASCETAVLGVSYNSTTEESILSSFTSDENAEMVYFYKYYQEGYPTITYIVKCTLGGVDQYAGEIIVLQDETSTEVLRMAMYTLAENGYSEIEITFMGLLIDPLLAPTFEDTNVMDPKRITVK
ncbi:MAG: zinc ribbon domain-containing protein [Oscillospiraceae bacterium]|nr:zinc ribbon domain-containing protein [Oscillospiraceae bacterium]